MEKLTEKQLERINNWQPFRSEDDIPCIPVVKTDEDLEIIVQNLIRCGAIPKKDLEIGASYLGSCRNASKAIWKGDKFEYERYKWGTTYTDSISHFEDEKAYDVFIPIKKLN